jgi:hypothetical protein
MKKIKCLDIFNADKKCFVKIKIESSPSEIWISFLEIHGSPSLLTKLQPLFSSNIVAF